MTPGLPTARCTTSMFLFAAIAGVTVQLPRMFSNTAAAAPGCPSMAEYCADCANLPNKTVVTSTPSSTPKGIRNEARPMSNPTTTRITSVPRPLPRTIGIAFGLDLRTRPATMRICFSRPALARSSAVPLVAAGSAAPDFLDMRAMLRSIRLSRPGPVHQRADDQAGEEEYGGPPVGGRVAVQLGLDQDRGVACVLADQVAGGGAGGEGVEQRGADGSADLLHGVDGGGRPADRRPRVSMAAGWPPDRHAHRPPRPPGMTCTSRRRRRWPPTTRGLIRPAARWPARRAGPPGRKTAPAVRTSHPQTRVPVPRRAV